MGLNATQKILRDHRVAGGCEPGEEMAIRIDQTLTQDATGTMAYLQFEAMGLDRVRSELAVSYADHNTIQAGPENADDHAYLQSAAARYGAVFSKPGNGICHQLHLERFGAPGKTLLGSDSHTPTCGGLGMVAIGAGGLDVAVAMGGGPFHMVWPRVIGIRLRGRLGPWVSAKDVILRVLEIFSTQGNVGAVFEYFGDGVVGLDVPERATIANMGAECGVTTSVFPSDARTRAFLAAQGRSECWRAVAADRGAEYERVVEIDLSRLEPLAAVPHSPGNIRPVASLSGMKVHQVLMGSCTNSSYRDLKKVARILAGRKVHPEVSVGMAPGSRQVLAMLASEGLLADLIASGVRVLENACGFCIGNSMSPPTGAVSLRTSNRNFEGRSGTASAGVYLVSPETAAVAALLGHVADPRSLKDVPHPRVRLPRCFHVDDSLFIRVPERERPAVAIVRGPGIGEAPRNSPAPDRLEGVVAIKVGDRVTTDHIMPAGPRLKYRSNIAAYSRFVFENVDPEFARRAASNRDRGVSNLVVAGMSYGQGSSREHAAMCPMYLGVRAVIARSFERIHQANLVNFGIVPFVFETPEDYEKVGVGDSFAADGIRAAVEGDGRVVLRDAGKGTEIRVRAELSARQKGVLLAGGLLPYVGRQGPDRR